MKEAENQRELPGTETFEILPKERRLDCVVDCFAISIRANRETEDDLLARIESPC
jgi:hypothetical protein